MFARHGPDDPRASVSTSRTDRPRTLLWYASLVRSKALASCRYRIGHVAEVLPGVQVVIDAVLPPGALSRLDALVILRPYPTRAVRRALAECRARGIVRIADYDDLLFGGAPGERPEVTSGRVSLPWMERAQAAYAGLLASFDAFTVSTEELAEELRAVEPGARITVVPNALSPSWVTQGRAIYPRWVPGERRVMRFLPGSPTHDQGFEAIAPGLASFMARHPDIELEVLGNLSWDAGRFPKERARHRRAVSFPHLPGALASAWVNLWPRHDTRFNRCKSPIKFLE